MGEREKSFDDVCMYTDTCALAGASAFFAGIRDAVIVVNGPLWCYYFAMRHIEHSQSTISHRMVCTQLDNDAIVFGAEEYLQEALAPYVEQPPALLAIVSSCAAGLIGDDIAAIARGAGALLSDHCTRQQRACREFCRWLGQGGTCRTSDTSFGVRCGRVSCGQSDRDDGCLLQRRE